MIAPRRTARRRWGVIGFWLCILAALSWLGFGATGWVQHSRLQQLAAEQQYALDTTAEALKWRGRAEAMVPNTELGHMLQGKILASEFKLAALEQQMEMIEATKKFRPALVGFGMAGLVLGFVGAAMILYHFVTGSR